MSTRPPALLLSVAAFILLLGACAHAAAFPKAAAVLAAATGMPSFYAGSFRGLWLADSATLFTLGAVFGYLAARPQAAARPVVVLLALIPAGTAGLIYWFVGGFFAAHLLMAAALATALAGVLPAPSGRA